MLRNDSVTGGTGFFGNTFVPVTLAKYNSKKIIIFSRDYMKQWEMAKKFQSDPRIASSSVASYPLRLRWWTVLWGQLHNRTPVIFNGAMCLEPN